MAPRISLAALLPLALVLACTDPSKAPAEAALQAAESAVASLGDVAKRFAPEQTLELQKALADAKQLAAQKDYKGALAAASAIPEKAKAVAAAAAAKKEELLKGWGELSASLTQLMSALQSRLGILSESKKLPAGLEQSTFDQAKAGAGELESGFAAAKAAAAAEDYTGAITQATALKAKGMEIMKSIGMMQ